ncbi:MAG: retropepsin-like domain-containing protein [Pirellulales bacterium]|nr:retropepsin-like domain-containing protein [Pirellulales bacterium]
MQLCGRRLLSILLAGLCALVARETSAEQVPLGGFIPFVGIGLTRKFETFDSDPNGTFFIADPESSWTGTPMGPGGTPYFDLALLDTGAATHILTQSAASASGFGIATPFSGNSDGFAGTNYQTIFGASGQVSLRIDDPLGVFAAGLSHGSSNGATLSMQTNALRGQSSFALLEGDASWKLPNILGLPIAAHHSIVIRNDQPQVFQHQGRTVRTPNIEFIDRGTGSQQQISRRTNLKIRPSSAFIQGPFYVQGTGDIFNLNLHEDPASPSVLENGALFVETDLARGANSLNDHELLFDTGADVTVVSELTAARLGFDVLLDTPDFLLEVEGAGGVTSGIPGFYLDQLKIDCVGGSFMLENVPVAVLDLPNPNDPGNVVDGILGMHLFTGRNLVIDANPAASPEGGDPPRLYISDPVTQTHTWAAPTATGTWATAANWSAAGTPDTLWVANVVNSTANDKTANIAANSTVYQVNVGAASTGKMTLEIQSGVTLTTFGEARIDSGGSILVAAGGKLDSQFVNLYGGTLGGEGTVFVGSGPVDGVVRNLAGRVAPGGVIDTLGQLSIQGDFANLAEGTLAIELGGTTAVTQYDRLAADRFAFLAGTLEVTLAGFSPSIGNTFTIVTATEGVNGQFEHLVLPAGYTWGIAYNAYDVVLSVTGLGLAGDFNSDGKVDAADYIVWRKNGGTAQEYQTWRANFGATIGAGAAIGNQAAVPEPLAAGFVPFVFGTFLVGRARCRRG